MNQYTRSDRDERTHPALNHVEFATRALIATGVVALVAVVLFLLWWARYVFFILFAGIVFQVFLQGTSDWINRMIKVPYKWSLGTVVVLLLIILGLAGWLIGDQIASQISQLAGTLPKSFRQLESKLQ